MSSRSNWSDPASFPERYRRAIVGELKAGADQMRALERRTGEPAAPTPATGRKTRRPEQALQMAIIELADQWPLASLLCTVFAWPPELMQAKVGDYLFHIPNGGGRSKAEAGIFKAMGVRPGVADLLLMVPVRHSRRRCWGGMFTELKAPGGKRTDAQLKFAARAEAAGYLVTSADSLEQWQRQVEVYFSGAAPLSETPKQQQGE